MKQDSNISDTECDALCPILEALREANYREQEKDINAVIDSILSE